MIHGDRAPSTVVGLVGAVGFEPTTSCSQSTCATVAPRPDEFALAKRSGFPGAW